MSLSVCAPWRGLFESCPQTILVVGYGFGYTHVLQYADGRRVYTVDHPDLDVSETTNRGTEIVSALGLNE
jgi:hypothetical protein